MGHIGNLEVVQESLLVIYDARTGRVAHTHHSVTMKGGKHPDARTLERDAIEQLAQAQPELKTKTAVLHANPKLLVPGVMYQVDVKKRALVALKPAKAGKAAGARARKVTGVRLA